MWFEYDIHGRACEIQGYWKGIESNGDNWLFILLDRFKIKNLVMILF